MIKSLELHEAERELARLREKKQLRDAQMEIARLKWELGEGVTLEQLKRVGEAKKERGR